MKSIINISLLFSCILTIQFRGFSINNTSSSFPFENRLEFVIDTLLPSNQVASNDSLFQEIQQLAMSLSELQTDRDLTFQELESLKSVRATELKTRLNLQKEKILQTADFVRAASNSANALQQSVDLSNYLNEVAALNNPNSEEIGFNLYDRLTESLEKSIFKNTDKVGNVKKKKFFDFIKNILDNPITKAVREAIPVVNSITNIASMVSGIALNDENIPVGNIYNFRDELKIYIQHYEGLAASRVSFDIHSQQQLDRLERLKIQLENLVKERIQTFYQNDFVEVNLEETNIDQLLTQHYKSRDLSDTLNIIILSYTQDSLLQYEKAINDNRLAYPLNILSIAYVINDEIEALTREHILELYHYQEKIESVLNKSKELGIGDPIKIDEKIISMQEKLKIVEESFRKAVQQETVQKEFERLRDISFSL